MATFTINDDNNITVFASAEEAAQAGDPTTIHFDSQAALARVSADWPLSRFVELWNRISGHQQVSKFADRKKAVARIWKAIQPIAERAQARPPEKPKAAKPAKGAKATKKGKAAKKTPGKKAEVIAIMKHAKGATLAQIMEATGWQKHTVRGFVSLLGSKGGEKIESSRSTKGERTYRINSKDNPEPNMPPRLVAGAAFSLLWGTILSKQAMARMLGRAAGKTPVSARTRASWRLVPPGLVPVPS